MSEKPPREIIADNIPSFIHCWDSAPNRMPAASDLLSSADGIIEKLKEAGYTIEKKGRECRDDRRTGEG